MRVILTALLIGAVSVIAGCDNATQAESSTGFSSADVKQDPAELNKDIEEFARTLAMSLGDVRVRQAVHQGVSEQFDGAPNILVKDIQDRTVGTSTFKDALASALARSASISQTNASQKISQLSSISNQLQIAVPVLADAWDPAAYTPLVAAAPYGIADKEIRHVKAYDTQGNLVLLDGHTTPDRPVIVISLNERTDDSGKIREPYLALAAAPGPPSPPPPPQPTPGSVRSGAYTERLERIRIKDDHEIWYDEPADIVTVVMCPGQSTPTFMSALGDPEPEAEFLYAGLNSRGRYIYRESSSHRDFSSLGITYFTWDRTVLGANCSHNLYEDDGGGMTTVSTTVRDMTSGLSTTVTYQRPINNADMGTVTFLYTDPLSTTRGTNDFDLDMK